MKLVILFALAVVIWSLGVALFRLAKSEGDKARVVRPLTIRIAISVALFLALVLAMLLGWIEPHGVNPA
ncbi:MAG: DUF2909 domain-containing protein [Gammaproteobacteria bacterium]|nr:DUF2909 domain-containing protein [Gammaproteobacteria bacterium]